MSTSRGNLTWDSGKWTFFEMPHFKKSTVASKLLPIPRPIYPQNVLFKYFRMHFVDCAEIASLLRKVDFSELRGRIYVDFVENSIWTKSAWKNARPFFEVK